MARQVILRILGDERDLLRALKKSSTATAAFGANVNRTQAALKKNALGLTHAAAGGTGFARSMTAANSTLLGVGGLAYGLSQSVKSASQFELTMQRIVGLSGLTQQAVNSLNKEVLALGPAVGRGPQELAEALYFISSSGITDATTAMEVLNQSARASAAGLGETQQVADAVTSVLNAYGPSAINAAQATDILVGIVREGKGEAADFAGVIGNVVSLASQLSVSFDEVGAALAAMTRLGTDPETAATQLQQVFSNLTKVTPQSEKALRSVGLTSKGLRATLAGPGGLREGLIQIEQAFKGNIPAMAKAFGDIRALRGVLALVGNQAQAVDGIFERLARSTGSLDKAFGAVADTPAQKFARFGAAVEAVKIAVGVGLAPALSDAAASMTKWLANADNQKALTDGIKDTAQALKDIVKFGKDTADALGGVKEAGKLFLLAFAGSKLAKIATGFKAIGTQAYFARNGIRAAALAVPILGYEVSKFIRENVPGWEKFWRDGGSDWYDWGRAATDALGLTESEADKVTAAMKRVDAAVRESAVSLHLFESLSQGAQNAPDNRATRPRGKSLAETVKDEADAITKAGKGITAEQRNTFFDNLIGRKKDRVQDIEALQGQIAALGRIADLVRARLAVTKDITRRHTLEDELLDITRQQRGLRQQIASDAIEAQRLAADKRKERIVRERERVARALETSRARIKSAQFRALGLAGDGSEVVPGVANLKKQRESLLKSIEGTFLDTSKTKSIMARIKKVLSGGFGEVSRDVRSTIAGMLADIRKQLQDFDGPRPQNFAKFSTDKMLEGLGLSPEQLRVARARLATIGRGGTVPIGGQSAFGVRIAGTSGGMVVNGPVYVTADNPDAFMRELQKRAKRKATQVRGVRPGSRQGLD